MYCNAGVMLEMVDYKVLHGKYVARNQPAAIAEGCRKCNQ
jgi:hypothetical protein